MAFKSKVTITRPANATAYTALDVVGGQFEIPGFPISSDIRIKAASLRIDVAAIPASMTTMRLHLYTAAPSVIADNAAWDLAVADRDLYVGFIDLGTVLDLGSTLYVENIAVDKQVQMQTSSLYGYLVTTAAYTPAGNSEVYVVTVLAAAA